MKLSETDESEFERLFIKKHGIPPIHTSLRYSMWNVAVWNLNDIASIVSNPRSVRTELDKIWAERANTDRNTVVNPVTAELNASFFVEPVVYLPKPTINDPEPVIDDENIPNLLLNLGMKNMGQLSTAESVKTNTECNTGDSNTAELVANNSLANQLKSKVFDTDGDRETVDQQERYTMMFFRSDFASDVILREAGIATGPAPPTDIQILRVTFADKPIGAGQGMSIHVTVTHKNGTS